MAETGSKSAKSSEVQEKLKRLRTEMSKLGLAGVRFKSTDWFAWITAGANPVVFFPSETGIAEVFITLKNAYVLTDRIESTRLKEEELSNDFEIFECPWQDKPGAYDKFIQENLTGETIKTVAADRPSREGEKPLPPEIQVLRLTFVPEEIARYQALGRDAGEAMKAALLRATPDWTEFDLAGAGADEQWKRGIEPVLALVSGESRLNIRRHPMPTKAKLGGRAMMVFSARRDGLYANITRFIYFREPTKDELRHHEVLLKIEAAVLDATKPGATLKDCYKAVKAAYAEAGFAEELQNHHQGGTCGYGSREKFAEIGAPSIHNTIRENSAVAWNPSLPGAKLEDTFLVQKNGLVNLTLIPDWPTVTFAGRKRPTNWIVK